MYVYIYIFMFLVIHLPSNSGLNEGDHRFHKNSPLEFPYLWSLAFWEEYVFHQPEYAAFFVRNGQ